MPRLEHALYEHTFVCFSITRVSMNEAYYISEAQKECLHKIAQGFTEQLSGGGETISGDRVKKLNSLSKCLNAKVKELFATPVHPDPEPERDGGTNGLSEP